MRKKKNNLSVKEKSSKKKLGNEGDDNEKNVTFSYKFNNNRRPKSVFVCGSFDNWKDKHILKYDNKEKKWICKMKIKKGKYFYKYIIDGNWEINPDENQVRGNDGIVNNLIEVN